MNNLKNNFKKNQIKNIEIILKESKDYDERIHYNIMRNRLKREIRENSAG